MSTLATWGLVVTSALTAVLVIRAIDTYMDNRPGGRRSDKHLDHLRTQQDYRATLRRIYEIQDRVDR